MSTKIEKKNYAAITAIGGYVPEHKRTNLELEQLTETSDEWIVKRTGIKERRILDADLGTSDMAVGAIENLLENYSKKLEDLEAVLVATSTPDMPMPATANIICEKLNIKNVLAFDLNAACSGFLYALDMGASLIESNRFKNVLVIGADKISTYVNIHDRATNILFGDGAGAVWLEASEEPGILDAKLLSNGDGREFLNIEAGGSLYPYDYEMCRSEKRFIKQEGKVVFKHAIEAMSKTCLQILEENQLSIDEIDWLIPHQANKRIIEAVGREIKIAEGKTLINIEHYGNTIAATIPLCIWENTHQLKKGDLVMLTAFGAGFSWGASLLRWAI